MPQKANPTGQTAKRPAFLRTVGNSPPPFNHSNEPLVSGSLAWPLIPPLWLWLGHDCQHPCAIGFGFHELAEPGRGWIQAVDLDTQRAMRCQPSPVDGNQEPPSATPVSKLNRIWPRCPERWLTGQLENRAGNRGSAWSITKPVPLDF